MNTKIESKIGKTQVHDEKIYKFLSDFNNFKNLVPQDKIKDWKSTADTCSFSVDMLGEVNLKMIDREPNSLIKITGADGSKFDFLFWIQLKEAAPYDTRIKLTIQVELNPMIKMMATKPLQNFVDTLVDQLAMIPYEKL